MDLSTDSDALCSNRPWVNIQSAGWVKFQSARTDEGIRATESIKNIIATATIQDIRSSIAGDDVIQ
jgi:ribosomal protein S5